MTDAQDISINIEPEGGEYDKNLDDVEKSPDGHPKVFHKKVFLEADADGEFQVTDNQVFSNEPVFKAYESKNANKFNENVYSKRSSRKKYDMDASKHLLNRENIHRISDIRNQNNHGRPLSNNRDGSMFDLVQPSELDSTIHKISMSPDVAISSFIDKTEAKGGHQDRIAFIYRVTNAFLRLIYILANAAAFALSSSALSGGYSDIDSNGNDSKSGVELALTIISGSLLALNSIETVFGLSSSAYASLDFAVNIRGLSRDAKSLLRSDKNDEIKWTELNKLSEAYDNCNLEYYSGKKVDKSEVNPK